MTALLLLFGLVCAYLAGSVNFAILLFRWLGKGDPRSRFSGNPGVTNVFRQAGWLLATLVLLLDVGRAMAVALLARYFWPDALVPWAGYALILGNHLPCFHGWRGGKGVANYLGFYALLLPLGTGLALAAYVLIFALTRVPFFGSFGILATLTGFGLVRWAHAPLALAGVLITAGSIVWFHRGNLAGWWQSRAGR
ncbi:MAG: glycerol-3-phosphate acyltransferase [Desulfatitalea sp.]